MGGEERKPSGRIPEPKALGCAFESRAGSKLETRGIDPGGGVCLNTKVSLMFMSP